MFPARRGGLLPLMLQLDEDNLLPQSRGAPRPLPMHAGRAGAGASGTRVTCSSPTPQHPQSQQRPPRNHTDNTADEIDRQLSTIKKELGDEVGAGGWESAAGRRWQACGCHVSASSRHAAQQLRDTASLPMQVCDLPDGLFGMSKSEWEKVRRRLPQRRHPRARRPNHLAARARAGQHCVGGQAWGHSAARHFPPLTAALAIAESCPQVVLGPSAMDDQSILFDSKTIATFHCTSAALDKASAQTACASCKKYLNRGAGNFGDELEDATSFPGEGAVRVLWRWLSQTGTVRGASCVDCIR